MTAQLDVDSTVRRFMTAFAGRDWDEFGLLLGEDSTWTVPGAAVVSGSARGRRAIIERARLISGQGVQAELLAILSGLEGAALILRNTVAGDSTRPPLDERVVLVVKVRHGKVVRVESYVSDVPAMERFYAPVAARGDVSAP